MKYENKVCFEVSGRRALFSDPVTRVGGEKMSYMIPTYQAIKGIVESVYWKPSFVWKILRVRVMNAIEMESTGIKPIRYTRGGNDLSYYTYLKNVCYQVEARFEWNENRPDLSEDWNENKHYSIAKRAIEAGGRRDIFLGTRECQGYVIPVEFGVGRSAYDETEELYFGMQFHSFIYPDEAKDNAHYGQLTATFWNPRMQKGIIDFIDPSETKLQRILHPMKQKVFEKGMNVSIGGYNELD